MQLRAPCSTPSSVRSAGLGVRAPCNISRHSLQRPGVVERLTTIASSEVVACANSSSDGALAPPAAWLIKALMKHRKALLQASATRYPVKRGSTLSPSFSPSVSPSSTPSATAQVELLKSRGSVECVLADAHRTGGPGIPRYHPRHHQIPCKTRTSGTRAGCCCFKPSCAGRAKEAVHRPRCVWWPLVRARRRRRSASGLALARSRHDCRRCARALASSLASVFGYARALLTCRNEHVHKSRQSWCAAASTAPASCGSTHRTAAAAAGARRRAVHPGVPGVAPVVGYDHIVVD